MTGLRELVRSVEHVDTDASGVVHFARYASLLETALLENLERLGLGLAWLGAAGVDLVVAELRVHYLSPARYGDVLRIVTTVDRVSGASCLVAGTTYRHRPDGEEEEPLARGSLLLCVVRRTDGKAVPLPAELRRAFQACREGDSDG